MDNELKKGVVDVKIGGNGVWRVRPCSEEVGGPWRLVPAGCG
jgi:hypothetical protein